MPDITRREFVKGAAAGAAAGAAMIAGASMLAGCDSETAPDQGVPEKWDDEADVVVVGLGGAGGAAALAAHAGGADVLVIEKLPTAGGTTAISGGWIWIPNNPLMKEVGVSDSREDALKYVTRVAEGQASQEIIEAFVDRGPETVQFLVDNMELKWTPRDPALGWAADYHPEWEGGKPGGRSISPEGSGPGLMKAVVDTFEKKGIRYQLETPAKRLIIKDKEVIGLIAISKGKEINIKAKKAVILAAGGFPWNEEMVKHFLRGPSIPTSTLGNTGDGILMGMAIGADLRNMNDEWGMPAYKVPGMKINQLCAGFITGKPGALVVNKYGKRFYNEAGPYDTVKRAFDFYDSRYDKCEYANNPAYLIVDAGYIERYNLVGMGPGDPVPEYLKTADTIKAIAEMCGIDADALAATVEVFNENSRQGVDPDFHRGESNYDRSWGGDPNFANPCLAPVETAPFYALEVWGGNIGTAGGLKVNAKSQVLTPFDDVIPRLYSAGNNAGIGGPGVHYGGGGGTVGPAMVFGYIAGKHAVDLESWENA